MCNARDRVWLRNPNEKTVDKLRVNETKMERTVLGITIMQVANKTYQNEYYLQDSGNRQDTLYEVDDREIIAVNSGNRKWTGDLKRIVSNLIVPAKDKREQLGLTCRHVYKPIQLYKTYFHTAYHFMLYERSF